GREISLEDPILAAFGGGNFLGKFLSAIVQDVLHLWVVEEEEAQGGVILMKAGSYLTATRGLAASKARIYYERGKPLCVVRTALEKKPWPCPRRPLASSLTALEVSGWKNDCFSMLPHNDAG